MPPDAAQVQAPNSPDTASMAHPPKPAGRKSAASSKTTSGKLRWMTIADLDGRTLACRRAHSLVRAIENGLPPDQLTEGTHQLCQRAAVLGTFIEACEAQWLAGENIELAEYLMAVNAQRRVLATIPGAMSRTPHNVSPSLSDIARDIDAEREIELDDAAP